MLLLSRWLIPLCGLASTVHAQLAPSTEPPCQLANEPQGGLIVTPDCVDPQYATPVIDAQTDASIPEPHHKVDGHFDGTGIRFTFHFPPKDKWTGRFFQLVYPTHGDEPAERTVRFALASGSYVVHTTGTQGYRHEAAAAKLSRKIAMQYYGLANATDSRIFGYVHGASGGSLQVVGAMENTVGVWDGGVPMVQAIPVSVGNTQTLRPMAGLVLSSRSSEIETALRPGGSGDPYASLTNVQRDVLREVVQLGLPIETFEDFYYTVDRSLLAQIQPSLGALDPSYVQDFWTKEGYLGSESSPLGELFRNAVVEFNTTVVEVERDGQGFPTVVRLDDVPASRGFDFDWDGKGYRFTASSASGATLGALSGQLDRAKSVATFEILENSSLNASLYSSIQPNARFQVSNREAIAMHAWYRYQVPKSSDDRGYIGFDHLRTGNGTSIYPQRPGNVAGAIAQGSAGGATHSGLIKGKMIVLQNLLDHDALPWWAHWYRQQVQKSLGERTEDNYRLWYNEHTQHDPGQPENQGRLVDYTGIFERALIVLSQWVERGVAPPSTTSYTLTQDNDVSVPKQARQRGGIQPSVKLSHNHNKNSNSGKAEVLFTAVAETPSGTERIVSVEWDFLGTGDFVKETIAKPAAAVTIKSKFRYEQPGDYVAVARVTSQAEGDAETLYTKVMNLGRVAVSVRGKRSPR